MKFDHYIFDLDGTLVNTKEIHQIAFNKTLSDFGLEIIHPEALCLYEAMPSYKKIEQYNSLHHKKIHDEKQFLARKNKWSLKLIDQSENLYSRDIYEIFSQLDGNEKRISICSNCTLESIEKILIKAQIYRFIDDRFIFHNQSCEPKPDPTMFRLAINQGRIDPQYCVIFEDGGLGVSAALNSHPDVSVVRVKNPQQLINFFQ